MKIMLNGALTETNCNNLLEFLLEGQFIESPDKIYGIAVSVNEKIISKKQFSEYELNDGDTVEVFTMVAGG